MPTTNIENQKGFTVIELMIGLLVGAIISAAAVNLFSSSAKSSMDNVRLAHLNQNVRSLMQLMARDIRRAGYVSSNPLGYNDCVLANPFFLDVNTANAIVAGTITTTCQATNNAAAVGATTDLTVYDDGSCLVYAYNRDRDEPPVIDADERMGFRLVDGVVQMRKSGTSNSDCGGNWEAISEPDIFVTGLNFSIDSTEKSVTKMNNGSGDANKNGACDLGEACNICDSGDECLSVRKVNITLEAQLANDSLVKQSQSTKAKVRSDKYIASMP